MFLALGHLTVTDELLMRSTSGLSDDARRGVAEDNNIPYIYICNYADQVRLNNHINTYIITAVLGMALL